jgi:hypothetical protein
LSISLPCSGCLLAFFSNSGDSRLSSTDTAVALSFHLMSLLLYNPIHSTLFYMLHCR